MYGVSTGQLLKHSFADDYDLTTDEELDYAFNMLKALRSVLKYKCGDTLAAIILRGPLEDGDVPSKQGRDVLLELGLIQKCVVKGQQGYQAANYSGWTVYKMLVEYKRIKDAQNNDKHP